MFSPDGRWMTYISDESGRDEVYVRPYPGPGGQTTVSTDGRCRADLGTGRAAAVLSQTAISMMVVSVETRERVLRFEAHDLVRGSLRLRVVVGNLSYDLAPEGDRFLMIQPLGLRAERRRASGSSSTGLTTCGGCRLPSSPPRAATLRINALHGCQFTAWVPRSPLHHCGCHVPHCCIVREGEHGCHHSQSRILHGLGRHPSP